MTYERRIRHRELTERVTGLRERLETGESWTPVTREEARELVAILEEVLEQISPERWDRMMESIVDEATRRAGALSPK
jgi:hypothetical protein